MCIEVNDNGKLINTDIYMGERVQSHDIVERVQSHDIGEGTEPWYRGGYRAWYRGGYRAMI